VINVINSCTTFEQLKTAETYSELVIKKFDGRFYFKNIINNKWRELNNETK